MNLYNIAVTWVQVINPKTFDLFVGDVKIGRVRKVRAHGYDAMLRGGRLGGQKSYVGWEIPGMVCDSRDSAERNLIERARNFGALEAS